MRTHARGLVLLTALLLPTWAHTAEPLHKQIDALIAVKAGGKPVSPPASDAEFLRRVYLDLAGRIPSAAEAREFLQERAADKREKLIDKLLNGPDYPRAMQETFNVLLMERLGEHADWMAWLRSSFEKNRPWDVMAREMLNAANPADETRGASFFMAKRLEHYGQNPVDYPALARDVGRLFLGVNLQCAQCHDHLTIRDYHQRDFQGLFAFVQNAYLAAPSPPTVGEKPTTKRVSFMSVFVKVEMETGPRVPGLKEVPIPKFKAGDEYLVKPDRKNRSPGVLKFSPLAKLAEELPRPDNERFNQNIANRLWFLMMGRGLVHPLDLHNTANPPSHPELLNLLAREFVAHRYDIKWMLRELALSQTYQRSSVMPAGQTEPDPKGYRTALEKRLSAEQLLWSTLEATGREGPLFSKDPKAVKGPTGFETLRTKYLKAFANQPRVPEEEFNPELKGALFVLNDPAVLGLLEPRPGNLMERLGKLPDDRVAEELYLSVLTRLPDAEEKATVGKYLAKNAARRPVALGQLAWALLASTEFCVNH
jgi:Protein of unknown function (DUF1549)/Protein of unknown function (DUF1553)